MAKQGKNKQIRITLKRSCIGRKPKHRRTAEALGLRRVNQSVVRPADAAVLGMVRTIGYLVEVEEL
ncbi:MAG: 50S ribosomal protein L30 [Spirochaetaceae bacterium]